MPRDSPGTVFLPGEEVFACPGPAAPSQVPQMRYPSRQRAHHKGWTSDLSPPGRGQSSGGALWTPAYTPGFSKTSWVYCNNPVLHLYISCYVTVNKPVRSYLLLRLLPQAAENGFMLLL
jgi:hypothetical protein